MSDIKLELGQSVYHRDVYDCNERLIVIGIKEHTVELLGDYSGGTNNVSQSDWLPISGVVTKQEKAAMECVNVIRSLLSKFAYADLDADCKKRFTKIIKKYT